LVTSKSYIVVEINLAFNRGMTILSHSLHQVDVYVTIKCEVLSVSLSKTF